jgi:hypothetical protein
MNAPNTKMRSIMSLLNDFSFVFLFVSPFLERQVSQNAMLSLIVVLHRFQTLRWEEGRCRPRRRSQP